MISFQEESSGSVVKWLLEGKLDLLGAEELEQKLSNLLKRRPPLLVVDLSKVTFVSTPGWATLINYQNEAEEFGGKILLRGLQGPVKDSFEIVGLEGVLTIQEAD